MNTSYLYMNVKVATRYLPILQTQFRCTVCTAMQQNINRVLMDCKLVPTLSYHVAKKKCQASVARTREIYMFRYYGR